MAIARSPPNTTSVEANTTVIGPVGPEICIRVPPSSAATSPSTIAPYSPAAAPAPEATPNASASGRATTPAVSPPNRSPRSRAGEKDRSTIVPPKPTVRMRPRAFRVIGMPSPSLLLSLLREDAATRALWQAALHDPAIGSGQGTELWRGVCERLQRCLRFGVECNYACDVMQLCNYFCASILRCPVLRRAKTAGGPGVEPRP